MTKLFRHTLFLTALAFSTVSGQAATTLYNVLWSGSGATAAGTIGIDTAALPNPGDGSNLSSIPSWLTSVDLTVSGSSAGNGHFTLADFTGASWNATSTLDLNSELVGQSGFANFNLVGNSSAAPTAAGTFTLAAGGGGAESMTLQSLNAAPEPSRALLLLGGLVGFALRRRRQVT